MRCRGQRHRTGDAAEAETGGHQRFGAVGDDAGRAGHRLGDERGVERPGAGIGRHVDEAGDVHGVVEGPVVVGRRAAEGAAAGRPGVAPEQCRDGVEQGLLVAGEVEVHGQPFGSPRCWWAIRLSCIS